ncbi:Fic family protein [Mucilaginibacter sp. OK268]|uniref:Fic family protein n=1 Tax=Mucilaginibacter sp. OK268 TaxID=1881048 RepID=UPI000892761A|nr:Fic family protein [Mucilaginibacter sp. OK268]SDP75024.1 Fic family protein [Mucilaginibacter sp. OK268]
MNLKLEEEFSKDSILEEIDALKQQIDDLGTLPPDVEGRVMQKLRLDWNYNSNAIEGNKLSYGETVAFLMEGITAKGKPLKDHLDIRGHNEAINFLLDLVKDERLLSEADIRALHEMILVEPYDVKAQTGEGMPTTKRIIPGVYKTTANHVQTATGEMHYYATPEETPAKMRELMEWYYEADNNTEIHPVVVAALFHHKFVEIHPFDDGNGRLSRILMNLALLKKRYPPVVVKMDDKGNYYSLLSRADVGESWPFVEYVVELLRWSLQLYLKAANGEEIDEDDDIDKKIALFKIEAESKVHLDQEKSNQRVKEVIIDNLLIVFRKLLNKIRPFDDLFLKRANSIVFSYSGRRENVIDHTFSDTRESFSEENIPHIIKNINDDEKEFSQIVFVVVHNDFKNSTNMFSIRNEIKIEFWRYNYLIFVNGDKKKTKLYKEDLSKKDITDLLGAFVNDFMSSFKEKQKGLGF